MTGALMYGIPHRPNKADPCSISEGSPRLVLVIQRSAFGTNRTYDAELHHFLNKTSGPTAYSPSLQLSADELSAHERTLPYILTSRSTLATCSQPILTSP